MPVFFFFIMENIIFIIIFIFFLDQTAPVAGLPRGTREEGLPLPQTTTRGGETRRGDMPESQVSQTLEPLLLLFWPFVAVVLALCCCCFGPLLLLFFALLPFVLKCRNEVSFCLQEELCRCIASLLVLWQIQKKKKKKKKKSFQFINVHVLHQAPVRVMDISYALYTSLENLGFLGSIT